MRNRTELNTKTKPYTKLSPTLIRTRKQPETITTKGTTIKPSLHPFEFEKMRRKGPLRHFCFRVYMRVLQIFWECRLMEWKKKGMSVYIQRERITMTENCGILDQAKLLVIEWAQSCVFLKQLRPIVNYLKFCTSFGSKEKQKTCRTSQVQFTFQIQVTKLYTLQCDSFDIL